MSIIDYAILAQVKKMGNGGGGTSGGGKIEPFTITHNGTFAPTAPALEFGKKVKFKNVITPEDFEAFCSKATPFYDEPGNESVMLVFCDEVGFPWLVHKYADETGVAAYHLEGQYRQYICVAMEGAEQWFGETGWYERQSTSVYLLPNDVGSFAIPSPDTCEDPYYGTGTIQMTTDLEAVSVFFEAESRDFDGFGEISANITVTPPVICVEGSILTIADSNGDLVTHYEIYRSEYFRDESQSLTLIDTIEKTGDVQTVDLTEYSIATVGNTSDAYVAVVAVAKSHISGTTRYRP